MKTDSTVVDGRTFLVTALDGTPARAHDGYYHRDTRHLDRYEAEIDEQSLETLHVAAPRPGERTVHRSTPLDRGSRSVHLCHRQVVTDGLYDEVTVSNLRGEPQSVTLSLSVGAAFEDLFEVRGHEASVERDVRVGVGDRRVTFGYDPADLDRSWATTVSVSRGSVTETRTGAGRADAVVEVDLDLDPGESVPVTVAIEPERPDGTTLDPATARGTALDRVDEREREWEAETGALAGGDATNGGVDGDAVADETGRPDDIAEDDWAPVLDESRENLLELRLDTEHGPMFAAGVPWFSTAFGRDSLIAAVQALPLTAAPAKGTCRFLAAHQAESVDEFREAEPGKILHELREGELAEREQVPHSPYYGTIDATALFVVLVHETWRFTGDDAFVESLWEDVEAALGWCARHGDRDGDGFLEYPTDGEALTHQAWKDSGDGIVGPDGGHPEGPLAVAEVQGYYYDALRRAADLVRGVMNDEDHAAALDDRAATLADAFDEAFWLPEESFYAVALDGENDPVESVTTNPGHCLWSGIVPDERADAVVDRLVADDVFTGWGLRTLSATHEAYNPQSYHRGSVWPHDSSLVALGMARYGRREAAEAVANGLVEAAVERGNDRLPELFAGFDRDDTGVPLEYGEACEPQAWAAAAPLACLRAVGRVDGPPLDF
ncbi:glycogen debranching N-terminal domain-containing protein [Halobium salinum]|uniref:Glycogen debranching N-terminal domain-containing protein n=1 Tax=Halobium salinum TaxID=1364940 RepID=A0ABD5PAF9_9EURY|nr:glycogen debranching N-terminal domain-containing protein [Halobium salinum]